ncbi:AAA family ATPase [Corynebacterium endometrii]|uniref:Chromosome partition protein Smc n=1 Tax=Corynebacterium endometrii TaxID=2488819 RepID=A0A4P7QEV6_9CORY|nr:AAA family ATPase [Corynebacterium endometrii]QCB28221.1 Chromosome partition protein Smc [Corynebacterium endometrii]
MGTFVLHSIELKNVRGIDHLMLDALPETGVVVIHGENEAGKSTILDALNVVLTEKHSARKKSTVLPLQPSGKDVGPEITVSVTVGPFELTIMKRFLRKASAELHIRSPRVERLAGREADERLEQILAEHLDSELMDTLFLRQDQLGHAVSAVGIPSLTQALEGKSVGAEGAATLEDTELMQSVEAEYRQYFTAGGRPTGEFAKLEKELGQARESVDDAMAKASTMDGYVTDYERLDKQLKQAEADLPSARTEVDERVKAHAEGLKAADVYHAAAQEAERAEQDLQRVVDQRKQRGELRDSVEKAEREAELLSAELVPLKEKAEHEKAEAESLGVQRVQAQKRLEETQAAVRAALNSRSIAAAQRRRGEIERKLTGIGKAEVVLKAAKERAAASGRDVTDQDVRKASELAGEIQVARKLYESSAAKLEIESSSGFTFEVDGQQEEHLAGAKASVVDLRQGTQISIGDVTLTYRAGADDSAEDLAAVVERLESQLANLLAEHECETLEELRDKREAHRVIAAELDAARREYALTVGDDDVDDLKAELARLEGDLEGEEDVLELSAEEFQAAEMEAKEARDAVESLSVRLDQLKQSPAALNLVRHEVKVENAQDNLERAQAALAKARESAPDHQLNDAVEAAEQARALAVDKLGTAHELYVAADVDKAAKLLEGSRARMKSLEDTVRTSSLELKGLEGYIQAGMGAAEQLEQAQAYLEATERKAAALRQRAEAARYLYELLLRHRDEAHAKYTAPFASALSALARTVYGGEVSFELDENLAVSQRIRNGIVVPLDQLSGGAKEQLAILTRFAIADLLGEGEANVPVIVDDALGSTDSTRLELMSTLFTDAGRHGQVIVLTCMPERYSRIPGRTEISISAIKAAHAR